MKITDKTKLKKLFEMKEVIDILLSHNFPCVMCPMAKMEMDILDIGSVCKMYGINKKNLINEINEFITVNNKKAKK